MRPPQLAKIARNAAAPALTFFVTQGLDIGRLKCISQPALFQIGFIQYIRLMAKQFDYSVNDIISVSAAMAQPGYDSIYEKKGEDIPDVDRLVNIDAVHKNFYRPDTLILPTDEDVYLPYLRLGLTVDDDWTRMMIKKAQQETLPIFLFSCGKEVPEDVEAIFPEHVENRIGAFAFVTGFKEHADGTAEAYIVTGEQGRILQLTGNSPFLTANVALTPMKLLPQRTPESIEISNYIEQSYKGTLEFVSEEDRNSILDTLIAIPEESKRRLNFMIQNSCLSPDQIMEVYGLLDIADRRMTFLRYLRVWIQLLELRKDIHARAYTDISQRQKDEFLRTQMRAMQNELSDGEDPEVAELREKAAKKEWNEETATAFEKEMNRLLRYAPNSPEYALQYSYLETFLNLPWGHCDRTTFELTDVEKALDSEHYGLDKVKKRIIEHMAVLKLRNDMKAPILCLYGPPGVGKTSLGKSIADAMGRKYMRVALGGVHDEAEIRGHRRTYLGSMPGRIITALEKCGTSDPVLVLDEIDKIGADFKGDPSTALLEVLDPEQNCKFHDNYIDHDYDLSNVLFIATANDISGVSAPLLDRMELIEIEGYVEDEKVQIAIHHLVPKNLKLHGFGEDEIVFSEPAIREIINLYTRESGVRRLEKKIADVIRKQACLKAAGKDFPKEITPELVREYLGRQEVFPDRYENNEVAGVVTGLAWTQVGGEILFIESSLAQGKDSKLTLTGNLGDVMKESAVIALQYLRSHCQSLGIDPERFDTTHVHIHVPEGAIPKDGPSAGITMLTSLASSFTKRRVRSHLAMTGEITLSGKVLPVGGIKEKILAAKRAGITTVMLCSKNRKDIEDIPAAYIEGMEFHFVDSADEVLEFALLSEPALR